MIYYENLSVQRKHRLSDGNSPESITVGNTGFWVKYKLVEGLPMDRVWELNFTPENNRDANVPKEKTTLYRHLFLYALGDLIDANKDETDFGKKILVAPHTNYRFMRFLERLSGENIENTAIIYKKQLPNRSYTDGDLPQEARYSKFRLGIDLDRLFSFPEIKEQIRNAQDFVGKALARDYQLEFEFD